MLPWVFNFDRMLGESQESLTRSYFKFKPDKFHQLEFH